MVHDVKLRDMAICCFLLAAAVLLAFSPVLQNQFTGYDDPDYVTNNRHVTSGLNAANLAWAFTHAYASNWHPLTWISHQLDCTLFGLNPGGHHLTSLLLHAANTILLFLWLSGVTGASGRSALVAAAFGVHPVHVESVAWVAERKDVLSTFFALLALMAYSVYTRRPGIARYCAVALLFAASLACKATWVTFPVLLVLLDWWPLRRKALLEKAPLLLLSVLGSAAAVWAQNAGASVTGLDRLPLNLRLANAALSYIRYLLKTAWPIDLAVFYPYPDPIPAWQTGLCLLVLVAVTAFALRMRATHPWIAMGWGWYVVTLLPVIGIAQIGMQAMADRYLYIPLIGLAIAVVWSVPDISATRVAALAMLAICAVLTWRQCLVWHDGLTLFEHAVAVTRNNFVAHDNLGVEFDRRGLADEALAHYREALRIRPSDRNASANVAQANFAAGARLLEQSRFPEAVDRFREGLQLRPQNALAHSYLGIALASLGRYREALASFDTALRLDPNQELAQRARAQLLPLLRP
jgi:tetratricopeptide (TPR) repeat protein